MSDRLPRRDFALVFMVLLTVAAGNTALQSVLPAIGRTLKIPDTLVGTIYSASALIWTFSAPAWARASDRRGRKRLMQVGMFGFFISMLLGGGVILGGLAGLTGTLTTLVLFASARMLFGIFGSASNPAAQAYVAGRTTHDERTPALATLASAVGMGTILGPAIAPLFVVAPVGLAGPMLAFAAIALLTLGALSKLLPNDRATGPGGAAASMPTIGGAPTGATVTAAVEGTSAKLSWRDPRVVPFISFGLVSGTAQAAAGQTMGFLILDRVGGGPAAAQSMIGIAFMVGAGATLLVQWGVMRMLTVAPAQALLWGSVLAALGTLGTAFAPDFHSTLLSFAMTSAGFGFVRPGFTAGASLAVGADEQGAVAGAVTAVNGAAFILAPTVGIALYALWHPLTYVICAGIMAGLALWAVINPRLRAAT